MTMPLLPIFSAVEEVLAQKRNNELMKPPLTVFVCSTFSDLENERQVVIDTIRKLELKHASMEIFGARHSRSIETCLEEVRKSDILVLIVGHQYGSLVPERGISFSEAEYAEGYQLKKDCLVYFRDDDTPILPKCVEQDPDKLKLLNDWKATLRDRHTVAYFKDAKDLSSKVANDLHNTMTPSPPAPSSGKYLNEVEALRHKLQLSEYRRHYQRKTEVTIHRTHSWRCANFSWSIEGEGLPNVRVHSGETIKFEIQPGRYSFRLYFIECLAKGPRLDTTRQGKSNKWEGFLKPGKYKFECGMKEIYYWKNILLVPLTVASLGRLIISSLYLTQISYEEWPQLESENARKDS